MLLELPLFIDYMKGQKNASDSTVDSYQRDLRKLDDYLSSHGVDKIDNVTAANLNSYILYLEKQGMSSSTVSRNVSSIKTFFRYIYHTHTIEDDPAEKIKAPHIDKKLPGILSPQEIKRLLEQPSGDSPKVLRDRAMLQLLYDTGMRINELISIDTGDIRLDLGYVICRDRNQDRALPFGIDSKCALNIYMRNGREKLLKGQNCDRLFVNCSGGAMSRQGFWKIVKQYAMRAGITSDITPLILRNSFSAHLIENRAVS